MDDMTLVQLALSDSEHSIEAREELLDRCKEVMSYHVVKYKAMYFGRLNRFDVEDLISECNIAVLESIELYDPSKGSGFPNFAKFIIRNKIIDLLRHKVVNNKIMNYKVDVNRVNVLAPEPYKEPQIVINTDNQRNRFVIQMMLEGYTQTEVAKKFNISRILVYKILRKCIQVVE